MTTRTIDITGIKRARSDSIGDSTDASQQLMVKSITDWLVEKTMRIASCLVVDEKERAAVFERVADDPNEWRCTTTLALMDKLQTLFGERNEGLEELAHERHIVVELEEQGVVWQRVENMLRNVALLKASYFRAAEYYDDHAGVCDRESAIRAFEIGVNDCQTLHLRKVTRKLAKEVAKHVAAVSTLETVSEQEDAGEADEEEDEEEEGEEEDEDESADSQESSAEEELSGEEGEDGDGSEEESE